MFFFDLNHSQMVTITIDIFLMYPKHDAAVFASIAAIISSIFNEIK